MERGCYEVSLRSTIDRPTLRSKGTRGLLHRFSEGCRCGCFANSARLEPDGATPKWLAMGIVARPPDIQASRAREGDYFFPLPEQPRLATGLFTAKIGTSRLGCRRQPN